MGCRQVLRNPRAKNAAFLDVADLRQLDHTPKQHTKLELRIGGSRPRLHIQNDRWERERLSKIAHMIAGFWLANGCGVTVTAAVIVGSSGIDFKSLEMFSVMWREDLSLRPTGKPPRERGLNRILSGTSSAIRYFWRRTELREKTHT